jgi:enoyl-CoA hydratase/carnithine racemase
MSEARVTLAIVNGIAHLTFDHPRRMKPITVSMWQSLPGLLDAVTARNVSLSAVDLPAAGLHVQVVKRRVG